MITEYLSDEGNERLARLHEAGKVKYLYCQGPLGVAPEAVTHVLCMPNGDGGWHPAGTVKTAELEDLLRELDG